MLNYKSHFILSFKAISHIYIDSLTASAVALEERVAPVAFGIFLFKYGGFFLSLSFNKFNGIQF